MSIESGDDYVASRIAIEVPDSTIEDVRRITQEVDRFRTVLEAAGRAEADASRYLEQMGEAATRAAEAQANLVQQLQTVMSLSERGGSTAVPLGVARSPFSEATAGLGIGRTPEGIRAQLDSSAQTNPREWLNMQQARGNLNASDTTSLTPHTIADLANRIATREHDVKEQDHLTHYRTDGSGHGSPEDKARYKQQAEQAYSLGHRVLNEMGSGGSISSMGHSVLDAIEWARQRRSPSAPGRAGGPLSNEGFEGGNATGVQLPPMGAPGTGSTPTGASPSAQDVDASGATKAAEGAGAGGLLGSLGKLGSLALKVGGSLSVVLGAFDLLQHGGQQIQEFRNMASVRGGAAGQGAAVEARAKLMAMNPFISQDQARQIYQSVMSDGYADASGAGADNVIDFMKHNLTSLNISVADSSKMLRDTIIGGGEGDKKGVNDALQMLGKELDNIRTISREGVISTPEFRKEVMSTQQALMNMGSSPEAAMQTAMSAEAVESGSHTMEGQFAATAQGLATPQGGAWLRAMGGPGGTPLRGLDPRLFPQVTAEALQEKGGNAYNEAVGNLMHGIAQQSAAMGGPEENQVYIYQQRLRAMGINDNATQSLAGAKESFEDALSGHLQEAVKAAGEEVAKQNQATTPRSIQMNGSVLLDLTPEAARLLRAKGGNTIQLTPTQRAANRGYGNASVNDDPDSMR